MQLAGIGVRQQINQGNPVSIAPLHGGKIGCPVKPSFPVEVCYRGPLIAAAGLYPGTSAEDFLDNDLESREQRSRIAGQTDINGVGHFAEHERLARLDGDLADPQPAAASLERLHHVVFVADRYAARAEDYVGTRRSRL